ncbi:MAG: PP2C family protein-serine/threonine phosphatase [Planctomycetota bacterium]
MARPNKRERTGPSVRGMTLTTEFHRGYEAETDRLLARRFMWFAGVMITLSLLEWAIGLAATFASDAGGWLAGLQGSPGRFVTVILLYATFTLLYVGAVMFSYFERPSGARMLRLTVLVVTIDGLIKISIDAISTNSGILTGVGGFSLSHLLAAAFLPWTAKQALQPAVIVLCARFGLDLCVTDRTFFNGASLAQLALGDLVPFVASWLLVIPGVTLCWIRQTRRLEKYKVRFFQQRYGEVRRELLDARRIHESLFPTEVRDGPVLCRYKYEPMRQIGGDFLYVCPAPMRSATSEGDGLNVVLLDVTGHGIPAALTVNRLHGELERIFAEDPLISPGEVLSLLNRYVHLTLASHSIYGTAVCVRIDPENDSIEYASGGHPPAFVKGVDGTLERLGSTSFVLGACPAEAFDADQQTCRFGPGDALVLYSDGATEARRNGEGDMLGIEGLERMLAASHPGDDGWASWILREVDAFRSSPPMDDTLIVEVARPLRTDMTSSPDAAPSEKAAPKSARV